MFLQLIEGFEGARRGRVVRQTTHEYVEDKMLTLVRESRCGRPNAQNGHIIPIPGNEHKCVQKSVPVLEKQKTQPTLRSPRISCSRPNISLLAHLLPEAVIGISWLHQTSARPSLTKGSVASAFASMTISNHCTISPRIIRRWAFMMRRGEELHILDRRDDICFWDLSKDTY